MTVKLLNEQHLEFLSLKGDSTGSSEPTLLKIPQCWKSHVRAQQTYGPLYKVSVFISYAKISQINDHTDVSSKARGLDFDLGLHLYTCFVYVSSEDLAGLNIIEIHLGFRFSLM